MGIERRIGAIFCAVALLAGCSPAPEKKDSVDSGPRQSLVVLAVQTGPGSIPGPIQGKARCAGELDHMLPPCLADDLELARAVLSCGPIEATIDRGSSHRLFVHFPARLHDRFPGMPADVDIVRCVQSRVGFSFSAEVATDPSGMLDGDPAPFAALHSKRP